MLMWASVDLRFSVFSGGLLWFLGRKGLWDKYLRLKIADLACGLYNDGLNGDMN